MGALLPPKAVPLTLPPGPDPIDMDSHALSTTTNAALAGDRWAADDLATVLRWAGRTIGPRLLLDAWEGHLVDDAALASHIGRVWSLAEYPDASLGHDQWRRLFQAAGFTADGVRVPLPVKPLTLWRGSVPARRRDWSWSTNRELASIYAAGGFGRPAGTLYRMVAPPAALLCANEWRDEGEYVVDTGHPGVTVTED